MIVRILGQGQLEVPDDGFDELNEYDEVLIRAVETGDEAALSGSLRLLLDAVTRQGSALPADHLGPSDVVLPGADATLDEVRAMLSGEGLIPG
jgi:hypothetical protein